MFQAEVVEKIKTHFLSGNFFPPQNHGVREIMWKIFFCRAREATDENMVQAHVTLGS
jgi:hypothetical protein